MISNKRLTKNFLNLLETILQENSRNFDENRIISNLEYFIQEHLESDCTLKRIVTVISEETEATQAYLYESNQLNENRELVLEFIKNAIKAVIKAPVAAAGYVKGVKDRATTAFGKAFGAGYATGRGKSYTGQDSTPTGFSSGRQAGEQGVIDRRSQQPAQQTRTSDRVTVNDTQPNYSTSPTNLHRATQPTPNQQRQADPNRYRQQAQVARNRGIAYRQFANVARQQRANRQQRSQTQPSVRTTNVGGSRPAPPVRSAINP
jgi:hypothetical protein